MPSDKTILEVKNLNVNLNSHKILKSLSFEIDRGELAAVVGPNGAGKTTLFRAVLGMIPYSGKIKIFGQPPKKALNRVGYVPQGFSFDKTFPITVEELLKLSLKQKNIKNIDRVLNEVEMLGYKKELLGELSGGQFQRIMIAKSLINRPEILFLDEPTMGVDIEGAKSFYDIIRRQNTEHDVTIIMISHEINVVYKYATKVICLNRDLVCFGVPKTAITDEILKKLYGENMELRSHKH